MYIGNTNYHPSPPNICPHCHVVNRPEPKWEAKTKDTDNVDSNISVWQCANSECRKLFIALYQLVGTKPQLIRFLNGYPKGPDWPQPILELENGNGEDNEQSRFIITYLQSLEAENYGLNEIAGMGFRKAVEYLVKDWAIKNNPDDSEKIRSLWLGQVIKKYYDGDLKDILERATWLGNDQAHYNKLFEEYDIDVLKELIALIMVELDRQHKMNHYIETIQSKK
ncbi:hypothetical protein QO206_15225 [Leeuwenhoekiella aequorea]|uniref:hypothetical protein n=1 Tax=Leeuwenhoekiella aequorea TaxID=283736 RepID=UPI00352CFC54